MVVDFKTLKDMDAGRKKTHYIIEIDRDEQPQCIERELKPGETTVFITARTLEEAEELYKVRAALLHKKKP